MAPLVSVIVPVYNVSPYLRQCMDSIVNQTLKDIEIICVDDGSTDDSLAILQEYAEYDSRITILQQENKGAGAARNLGMTKAAGKYLIFLDSDDFFDLSLISDAYQACEKENADIVIFNSFRYDNITHRVSPYGSSSETFNPLIKSASFNYRTIAPGFLYLISTDVPWNKLFRKSFIIENNIFFSNTQYSNDIAFSVAATYLAKCITYLNKKYIYYRKNIKTNLQSSAHKSWEHIPILCNDIIQMVSLSPDYSLFKQDIDNKLLSTIITYLTLYKITDSDNKIKEFSNYLRSDGFKKLGLDNLHSGYIRSGFNYFIYNKIKNNTQFNIPKSKLIRDICHFCIDMLYGPKYAITYYYLHLRRIVIVDSVHCK